MAAVVTAAVSTVQGVQNVALQPILTGPLLWALTKAPPRIREQLLRPFASLPYERRLATIIKTLKVLFVLGLVSKVNKVLNVWALNLWRAKSQKDRWVWNKEIAVVTGGCSGIGELVVKGLMKKGVRIAVLDIQALPESLQNYANIKFYSCDITDHKAVASTAAAIRDDLGEPSILINNAGIGGVHTILETTDEQLHKVFDVNLLSHWTTVKEFLPHMIAQNKGHIVSVASLASYVTVAGIVDYCSTKAGLMAFHEGLNQELKHRYKAPAVLTTSVHPNWVQTPLVGPYEESLKRSSKLLSPNVIADGIVKQVLSCKSAQLIYPANLSRASILRGWPNWLQEFVRDGTRKFAPSSRA